MNINNSFLRFLIVGVVNTIIGLTSMYSFFKIFGLDYWVSTLLGNAIGAVVSYSLNKIFTFKNTSSIKRNLWKFILVIVLCYFISYYLGYQMSYLLNFLGNSPFDGYIEDLAIFFGACIYTLTNYLGQKFFVFGKNRAEREIE